ncbi:guanine nucleotide-binding protein alpha subunit [Pseudohyphozyma bogoriensis]|nr:guanine nucleotide-binding protein alpha subunit [Pseudohyphozyma bogoriensis]
MGCGSSSPMDDPVAAERTAKIDAALKRDGAEMRKEVKILFPGAGESGKSTVIKQMCILNKGPYSQDERNEMKEVILSNAVQSMQAVINGFEIVEIPLPAHLQIFANYLLELGENPHVTDEYGDMEVDPARAIKELWAARETKDYFDSIDRLSQPKYVPTEQDVLRARIKSTGIAEVKVKVNQLNYRLFDVGGQRSERKKWVHCFENVNVLIFVVAISEYNQMLYEVRLTPFPSHLPALTDASRLDLGQDEMVSRMTESETLWDSISNSRWFKRTTIILFLNKIDIFQAKLPMYKFSDFNPDYKGPNTYADTTAFIVDRFKGFYRSADKPLFVHLTCATDTATLKVVLMAVSETILAESLNSMGLI